MSLSSSSSSSGESAVEKELPTFRIGRNDHNRLSAAEVANILYRHTDISNGFICGRMAYMSHYRHTYKFASVKELQQAIEQYCKEKDTSTFDFSEFHIYFAAGSYLKEITIIGNREDRRHLFRRSLQSEIRAGSSDAAAVYRRLFKRRRRRRTRKTSTTGSWR